MQTIESVEQEVERLLDEDSLASEVKYGMLLIPDLTLKQLFIIIIIDILENVNPDLSDSELIEHEAPLDAPTPAISDLGDGQIPGDLEEGDEGEESEEHEDEEGEGDIDEELAAELDLALENEDEEGDGDDEDEESEEEDSEDEDDEDTQAKKLLSEEIRDLEAAVSKKRNEIASSANPLIRVCRFLLQL